MKSLRSRFNFKKRDTSAISTQSEPPITIVRDGPSTNENSEESQDKKLALSYSTLKAGMKLAKEVSAVFGPLQSVVGGLLFIMEHHEVSMLYFSNITVLK